MLRTVTATRYVTPLREGGSLPAIIEGDDDGTYVAKFRGAGQGHRALIAELIAGELGRHLGLRVPEIVLIDLDSRMARTEPDEEIQDLLRKSEGLNLGIDYLPGSITFDPLVAAPAAADERFASAVVWFDALITNVDRTARNTNLLVWHRRLWLIDHGASLYFHHSWPAAGQSSRGRFPAIREHVLLPWASALAEVDAELTAMMTPEAIEKVVATVPDAWLGDEPELGGVPAHREAYRHWFLQRLEEPRAWVEEATRARAMLV